MKTQLKPDEALILETKPHWFTLALPFLITLTGSIISYFLGYYGIITVFILLVYFFYKLKQRTNNLWAVTNLRIVDEYGVFLNNSKESPLEKINNVSYFQSFWGRLFGYGDVQIQTAAEIGSTFYSFVENPKELKDTITQMQEAYKYQQIKRQATELAQAIATKQQTSNTEIASELEKLYELNQRGILTDEEYNARKIKILNI